MISDLAKPVHQRRLERKSKTAEEFTPAWLVNQMLDKLPEDAWSEGETFCDPACGNGNMLVEVLKRKLKLRHDPFEALSTLYGCDIMADNIRECRLRLLGLVSHQGVEIVREHVKIVFAQIVQTPLEHHPRGSLDYDFSFQKNASNEHLDDWLNAFQSRWAVTSKDLSEMSAFQRLRGRSKTGAVLTSALDRIRVLSRRVV